MNYNIPITKTLNWNPSGAGQINALIAGSRGMGKSWMGMYLTIKLAKLKPSTQIYCIDFKRSDIYSLRTLLPKDRVAGTKEEIFNLLEHFVDLMRRRGEFVTNCTKFGETSSSLGMPLYYLIYDEFGAVTATLDSKEKKKHDELITQICLLGRAYNFGLLAIMQQASVGNSGLTSNVKEQFGLIVHMGTSNASSYRLTFGETIEVPRIHLASGQGLIHLDSVTTSGNVIPFAAPYMGNLDLWNEFKMAFTKQDEEYYLRLIKKG